MLVLSACAGPRPAVQAGLDQPVERYFGWFRTVAASDLRQACGDGRERYRFVYNGRYDEQLRVYDVDAAPARAAPTGGELAAYVRGQPNLLELNIEDPLATWRGRRGARSLSAAEMAALRDAVAADGLGSGGSAGLRLPSDSFYWLAAGCRDGRFVYGAWRYANPAFAALRFPALLLAWDQTGEPFNPPRPSLGLAETPRQAVYFELSVGADGLAGVPDLGAVGR
jgi:hypothetical protein